VYVGVYSENLIDFETGKEENFLFTLRIVNELFGIIVRTCQVLIKIIFCSTLSEFENFLLCERILINLTTCQNETSS
jgi:hypothetical protein